MNKKDINKLENQCRDALNTMRSNPQSFGMSIDKYFDCVSDGDFNWCKDVDFLYTDDIPVEWYNESGWFTIQTATSIKRVGKERTVSFHTRYQCGDQDYEEYTKECEDYWYRAMTQHPCYTLLKQHLYALYCVETGKDPLDFVFPENQKKKARYFVRYTPTIVGYRVVQSRKDGCAWKDGLSGLPKDVAGCFDATVRKKETSVYRIYDGLLRQHTSAEISQSNKFEFDVSSISYMTLKLEGVKKSTVKTPAHIKRVMSRNLKKDIQSTVQSVNQDAK